MRLEDFERKVFNEFQGLYSRGEEDQAPEDHFLDVLNVDYDDGEWKTRAGLSASVQLGYSGGNGRVARFASFTFPEFGNLILVLDTTGNLYTYSDRTGDNATTPLINVPGATDFSAIIMLGKIFIGFHDGTTGLFGVNLKVLTIGGGPGNDVIRDAGGIAPSGGLIVANNGAAGIINSGTYKIAVSFETSTGYITQPGPKNLGTFQPTSYTSPGAVKINLSNIPIGPVGTLSRQIIITKADGEEYFYVPSVFGGLIEDNVTTTTILDFDDTTDLIDSADSLFDLMETIPAPLTLEEYNDRLVIGGEANNASILRISPPGEPEAIDAIDGIVFITKDDGFTVHNLAVLRTTLYVWKNVGAYSLNDNDDVPSSWSKPVPVDPNITVGVHGIGEFFDINEIKMARDWTLVADRSGIVLFDGIVRKPPITYKVNDIWQSINFLQYHKVVLAIDDQNHKIYCTLPVDFATDNNKIIVGDYNSCPGNIPEASKIKWSIWEFRPYGFTRNASHIAISFYPPDNIPIFKFGSNDGGGRIWSLDPSNITDDGADIESYLESSLLFWEPGYVHFFTALRTRVTGQGVLLNTIRGLDNILSSTLPDIILSSLNDYRLFSDSPYGSIDGINNLFILNYPITAFGTAALPFGFQNGLLIKKNTDFTLSGTNITMSVPPLPGDILQFISPIGTITSLFRAESPTGSIDGSNVIFALTLTPADSNIGGFQNGLILKNGIDFTVVGTTVTMAIAPLVGDTLQFIYNRTIVQPGIVFETPVNGINGVNTLFSLSNNVKDGLAYVFQNGLLLRRLIDYIAVNNKIMIFNPPQVGDTLQVMYRIGTAVINPGYERLIRFNFQNEKAKIKMRMTAGKFVMSKLEYFGTPVYSMRPM